jgi:hypothetical protein
LYILNYCLDLYIKQEQKTKKTMKRITNSTGRKAVIMTQDAYKDRVYAFYVDIYQGEEQVLTTKDFANYKNAEKWAAKILN